MKQFLFGLIICLVGFNTAYAFSPIVTEITVPYEIINIETEPEVRSDHLGELLDYPIMYEITAEEGFNLRANIRQEYSDEAEMIPFSLIVVRKNDRGGGVKEIVRQKMNPEDWTVVEDSAIGLDFWQGPELLESVPAGTYRVEISTPENIGRYLISFGNQTDNDGFFKTLSGIRETQKFFGHTFLKMLSSTYVYYPIGMFLMLWLIYKTWFYRKVIFNVA